MKELLLINISGEDKPGVTTRNGGPFSTWWNGGLRTTAYFHNVIGLLTETVGNPTPIDIPFMPNKQLPSLDMLYPIGPREWHFRESVEYSVTANRAVLDYASRYRETLLLNIYRMGRNSIERGSRDYWTLHPKRIDALMDSLRAAGLERELRALGTGPLAEAWIRGSVDGCHGSLSGEVSEKGFATVREKCLILKGRD